MLPTIHSQTSMNTAVKGFMNIVILILEPEGPGCTLPRISGRKELRYRMFRRRLNDGPLISPRKGVLSCLAREKALRNDSVKLGGVRVSERILSMATTGVSGDVIETR